MAVAIGVATGSDDHRVNKIGAKLVGKPSQMSSVCAVGCGCKLDLNGKHASVLLNDQINLSIIVPGSQMPY